MYNKGMNEDDAHMLRQHAHSADIIELLVKNRSQLKRKKQLRIASILLALLVFAITLFIANNSNISSEKIGFDSLRSGGGSPLSRLLGVSFLGLCMVLFSSKRIASLTGFSINGRLVDKPTPLFLFHVVGWILLILIAVIFLLS